MGGKSVQRERTSHERGGKIVRGHRREARHAGEFRVGGCVGGRGGARAKWDFFARPRHDKMKGGGP